MQENRSKKMYVLFLSLVAISSLAGCANMQKSPPERNTGYYYLHNPLTEASQKVDAARIAGKDKECPAEFKAAKDTVDNAYAIYIACRTQEGIAMAQDGISKVNALCPPPVIAPKPAPVVVPPPPAPSAKITANPVSIDKGATTSLAWSAENTSECTVMPGVGAVPQSGNKVVSPEASTTYKLVCKGAGGTAESSAVVNVIQPPADSDKDGVIDPLDKCPNTPLGTKVDKDGCPVIECKSAKIEIDFDTNKSDIKPVYHAELDKVAAKLNKFPKATAVIEGHTDNVGADAFNQKLSERRAQSVKTYLVEKLGIAADRLSAKGFGETKPIDSNKTAEGRSKNRRVESTFTCP
jgi:OOP family OmpA-OmpF porin